MAEFKLGRIKFVWQGAWTTGTAYVPDDLITISGQVYICVTSHTAAALFSTDLTSAYWQLAAGGLNWKGTWNPSTLYNINDLVQWGGTVYACNTSHTSATYTTPTYLGLENDQSKWTSFATSFSWIGAWAVSTRYKVRDIISYGGVTYICNTSHISAATTALGLENDSAKWDTFNAGFTYTGVWAASTRYKLNDVAKFGADLYICTAYHTSAGNTPDLTKFSMLVNGFEFKNTWSSSTYYAVGDNVTYGGYVYTAIANNNNQDPTSNPLSWQPFTTGLSFQGSWSSSNSYLIGQVVALGGYTYLAAANNSVQTLTITGTTISSDGTRPNQLTTSGSTGVLVAGLPITFGTSVGGLVSGTVYYVKDLPDTTHFTVSATSGGAAFTITSTTTGQSVTATTNPSPPFSTYWTRLNSGFRWNVQNGSAYTALTATNTLGTGTGATWNVTRSGTSYVVALNAAGSGYAVNNTLKIVGTSLGGLSPANDINITINSITNTPAAGTIVTFTTTGISSTWLTATGYVLGDAVYFGTNSYVCILAHSSTSGNRPDADTTGTYWNLLASGTESGALTTQGDIVYYGANGPQRLPIGTDGQILRVSGTSPAWQYYGQVNNVVYVAPTGTDAIGNGTGTTIDKPWATVRYAAQQIENGYLNLNAQALLAKNKQFMMKEISNYVVYQYSFNITASSNSTNAFTVGGVVTTAQTTTANMYAGMPISFSGTTFGGITVGTTYYVLQIVNATSFTITATYGSSTQFGLSNGSGAMTGALVYNTTKCERDTGLIVDAVVYDLGHGGTLQTTTAALSYFTSSTSSTLITTPFGYQAIPSITSWNYLKTLVGNVLSNTAPTTNYQTQEGISAGSQANQIIDNTITAESTANTTASSLIGIVTTGLTAGTATAIPAAINPGTTISIKTGTYNEVLPIVISRNTAVVGDELRGTVIQPASANLNLANDKTKSVAALLRTKALLTNLIGNTVIAGSTGNSQVLTITSSTGSAGTAILSFAVQTTAPFTVGQYITVSGFSGGATGYNGSYVVTGCTTASVSFANATTAASAGSPIVSSQVTALTAGDTGSSTAVTSVVGNSALIQNIFINGLVQVPAFTFTNPTGYNATYLVGYGDGKAQIVQNYAFIVRDCAAYFATNYATQWGSINQSNFYLQVQYILDALQYDMTYGCNNQTLIAASNYYSYGQPQLTTAQTTAYVGTYTFLQSLINTIVTRGTVTKQGANPLSQTTSGNAGTAAAGSFAQARLADVIYWINNGGSNTSTAVFNATISTTTLTIVTLTSGTIAIGMIVTGSGVSAGTYITGGSGSSWTISVSQTVGSSTTMTGTMSMTPVTSGAYALASSALQTAYTALQSRRAEIQSDTQYWVQKYYQAQPFTQSTCYRDAGYIVDALSWDLVLGTNFNSIISGRQYYNGTSSAAYVVSNQSTSEVGAIGFIGYKAKQIAASGSIVALSTTLDDVIANINGQVTFTTAISASVGGTQIQAYSSGDTITVTTAYGTSTFTPTLTTPTTGLTITNITNLGVATFSNALTVVRGQSVYVPVASGGMSAGTYYVALPATTSSQVTLATTYANAVAGTAGSFTGGAVVGASSNVIIGQTYNTIASVTVLSGGTWSTTVAGNLPTTPSSSTGLGLQLSIGYGQSSYSTTVTVATTSTNVITVGSTTGMVVGMPIVFAGLPANITTTASAISSNQITLGATVASLGIVVGQQVYFSGIVFGGVNPNTTYYVQSASASIITIAATLGGAAISLTNVASGSMNLTINAAGGLISGDTYWINSIASTTTLTVTGTYPGSASFPGTVYPITNTISATGTCLAGASVQTNGTTTYNNTLSTINGVEILRANTTFLAYEASAYISSTYTGTVTTTAITNASITGYIAGSTLTVSSVVSGTVAVGMLLQAVGVATGTYIISGSGSTWTVSQTQTVASSGSPISISLTNYTLTTSSAHNLVAGDPIQFTGTVAGGVTTSTKYFVLTTPTTTTMTIGTVQYGQGVQSPFALTATSSQNFTITYYYSVSRCVRDTTAFINALIYDVQYPGNYKSIRAAILYNNAVKGSALSDMFYVRNGSGVRNMTTSGLNGYLTAANSFGTKRPTAGAYVSLDPGFGPNDTNAWVTNKSCYVQNVTTFGVGCVGCKIDGALHSGGNKSIVSNDFTQVLSDGIGVWTTGTGALTELVSVFAYYNYSGYLAELGGKIRATNGNSSYGTYGTIAEGVDTYETPIVGTVNNRYNSTQITNVITDGANQVWRLEYANAGINYTNAVPTIVGAGVTATTTQDEFRDAGVFETRIVDLNNGQGTGGSYYLTATSIAQGGSTTIITLAATDTQLSNAYVGMRIQITNGTGVGQYANIVNYNSGTKVAQIVKDSFTNLTVTGSTTTQLVVASTQTLYTNMPLYFSSGITATGLTANTVYYVQAISSGTNFTVSASSGGAAVTGLTATSTQTITLYAAGWDHVIPGTTSVAALDLSTTYIIEPRISYTAPGYVQTALTLPATATWQAVTYGAGNFVTVATGGTATGVSTNGTSWTSGGALSASSTWQDVVYGGGQGATATAVVGGLGGVNATFSVTLGGTLGQQVVGITVTNGGYGYTTPPTLVITGGSGTGATAICQVLNGAVVGVTVIVNGSGYSSVPTCTAVTGVISSITASTWGRNYYNTPTVTIGAPYSATAWSSGGTATQGVYYSFINTGVTPNQTNYYLASSAGTFTTTGPTHTTGTTSNGSVSLLYVGTLAAATANVSTGYGINSYTLTSATINGQIIYGGYGYTATPTITVIDSTAKFVAIRSGASAASSYSTVANLANTWTAGNTLQVTDLVSVAYGNNLYVAVGGTTGVGSCVTSPDGATWTNRSQGQATPITSLSGSATYSAVCYGAGATNSAGGTFVAIATGSTVTSISNNGTTWSTGGVMPANTTWTSVAYGNNRFVAISVGGVVAYSVNYGVTWVQVPAGLNSSYTWSKIRYGQGLFFAIASGTSVCATSPDGINWTTQAMPSSSNWNGIAFGNPISGALGATPIWAAVSVTSGTVGASINTGATPLGRVKVSQAAGTVTEVRMIEPGGGYPKGNVTNTTVTTNLITVDNTINLVNNQPVYFTGTNTGGIITNTYYYVVSGSITSTQFQISTTLGGSAVTLSTASVSGMTYYASPIITLTDPNHINNVALNARTGNGIVANPSFTYRGTGNTTASASDLGDGYADLYQPGNYINILGLYTMPSTGANVQFGTQYSGSAWKAGTAVSLNQNLYYTNTSTSPYTINYYTVTAAGTTSLAGPTFTSGSAANGTATLTYIGTNPNIWYKLVQTSNQLGIAGNYTAQFQINPALTTLNAPIHGTTITTRLKYSQTRLTGHDFLYIGTGNQTVTNYPYVSITSAVQGNQTYANVGGRVFYTSTDQDGNFNVGNLFTVQQATGVATLNASAFNLTGLQSLTLGSVTLGAGSATITQFSTDPYFTANSDSVLPTQKAIKSYITSQIGGGLSSLNVNSLTAGNIYLAGSTITTLTGGSITVSTKMTFTGGIDGSPVALVWFGQR